MKVSVVLTVHNTEKQLATCIKSILNQTLRDFKLIIINDASPDNSLEIIRSFAQKDNRITVYNLQTNVGVSRARNLGLKYARGEYVCFIDSDDYIDENMLQSMYDAITENDCDMAVCNYSRIFDDYCEEPFLIMPESRIIDTEGQNGKFVRDVLGERVHIGGCVANKLFNTEFLLKSGVLFTDRDEIFAEDAYFYFMLLPILKKICIVNKPLYFYYQRNTSASHTYKPELLDKCKRFLEGLNRCYRNLPYFEQLKQDLNIRAYTFFLDILYNETLRKTSFKNYKSIFHDTFFNEKLKNFDVSVFSVRRRLIYFFYKYKQYSIVYLIFIYMKRS